MRRLLLTAIVALVASGCAGSGRLADGPPVAGPRLAWASVDSLDAQLPPGVRVFAGLSEADTLRAWAVRLAPDVPLRVEVAADTADGRETPTAFARRTGACVVLNGGYFNMQTGVPVGLVVRDRHVEAPAVVDTRRGGLTYPLARGAVGVGEGGVQIAWARSAGGVACRERRPPGNRPGVPAATPDRCVPWAVRDALSAGPVLLQNGRVAVATDAEVFFGTSIPNRHPRSAVGVGPRGVVWLVVVDGRQPLSRGVTLEELAALLRGLGASDGLNLDGGGSSALVVRPPGGAPVRLNRPVGHDVEREVSTALLADCGGRVE